MYLSPLFTLILLDLSLALAVPLNSTLLDFPLSISPGSSPPINHLEPLLQAWPPTPWTLPYDSNFIIFQSYGRQASPDFEVEIVVSLQDIYDQVVHSPLIGWHSLGLQSGNVAFVMVFYKEGVMTEKSVTSMLAEVQVLFLNHMNGPREILRADVRLGRDSTNVAAFQIVFKKVTTQ